jgi:hypothetical protein
MDCKKGYFMGLAAACTLFVMGCSGVATDEDLALMADGEVGSTSEALSGPTQQFTSYTYGSSNGTAQVERFRDCLADQVMTGVGARVVNDNFTDLTVYCRDILANGTLSANESQFTHGGASEEKRVNAHNGQVVIGAGGIVSNDNVVRLVIRECPWNSATRRIDIFNCSYRANEDGTVFSTEKFFDTHSGASDSIKQRTVATGVGFTSSGDNVFAVRMSSGLLR